MKLARLSLCLVFALALLAGCGGDSDDGGGGSSDEDQINEAIATFGESGSGACDVLTDEFVEQLFGGREECEKAASEGNGTDIEVDDVQIDGDTATAQGTAEGDTATITLEKVGEDWQISGIEQEE